MSQVLVWWGMPLAEVLVRAPIANTPCWEVYDTTQSADQYVEVSKVERSEGALQSILKIKKLMVVCLLSFICYPATCGPKGHGSGGGCLYSSFP